MCNYNLLILACIAMASIVSCDIEQLPSSIKNKDDVDVAIKHELGYSIVFESLVNADQSKIEDELINYGLTKLIEDGGSIEYTVLALNSASHQNPKTRNLHFNLFVQNADDFNNSLISIAKSLPREKDKELYKEKLYFLLKQVDVKLEIFNKIENSQSTEAALSMVIKKFEKRVAGKN